MRATEIEGHPDNVAAAIYGGFVVCGAGEGRPERGPLRPAERARGHRRNPRRGGLHRARPRGDPGRGPARRRGRQRLRRLAPRPRPAARRPRPGRRRARRPHPPAPPPRPLPTLDGAGRQARELGALGATISGAGPTVLVWTTWQDAGKVAEALEDALRRLGRGQAPPLHPPRRRRPRAVVQRGRVISAEPLEGPCVCRATRRTNSAACGPLWRMRFRSLRIRSRPIAIQTVALDTPATSVAPVCGWSWLLTSPT